jgi:type II secretory pathway pseudopilin PulG
MRCRSGFSLVEILTGLLFAGVLATVLGGALVAQLRLTRNAVARAASADAVRTAGLVLQGELRRGVPGDLRAISADSIGIRAFRGLGEVCAVGADHVMVRYRGDRLPHAGKDSLALIDGSGAEWVSQVMEVRTAAVPCPLLPGYSGLRIGLDRRPPGQHGVGLVFESGRYFISSRALRYRLGGEGRQPLTAELFAPGSGFQPHPRGVRFRLHTVRGDSVGLAAFFSPMAGVP